MSGSGNAGLKDYYLMQPKDVQKQFKTIDDGLSEAEAKNRQEKYGFNALEAGKKDPNWKKFLRQFTDALVIVLLIAAVITAIMKPEDIDWIVIAAIVIITATIGYMQEAKAEEAIEQLKKMSAPKSLVTRSGKRRELPAAQLVPGDMVFVESGMIAPADCRVVSATNLKVNEAALTGESMPEEKHANAMKGELPLADRDNMLYMSTLVETGHSTAVVTATGMQTEIGKIAGLIQAVEKLDTPLQQKLKVLGKKLGLLILIACIAIFAIGIVREFGNLETELLLELFETSVSLAVAAIPEGLPAVVTISLAIGLKAMAKKNVIVRKLPVVETLGSATVICTDKTGTLTTGVMTADVLYINKNRISIEGTGYSTKGRFIKNKEALEPKTAGNSFLHIMRASALCGSAVISKEKGETKVLGDTTEGALLIMARKARVDYEQLRKQYPSVEEHPFDSTRKMMSTVQMIGSERITYTKGAPEQILNICVNELVGSKQEPLTDARREEILELTIKMARSGYRTLAFAMDNEGRIEEDSTFLGIVGIRDQMRPEAKEAIERTKSAGIRVIMITGDHRDTAAAIGKDLGLITKTSEAINCAVLDEMDEKQLLETLKKVSIFARASPEHKVKIIKGFRKAGEIVAMTGDGVNDAPALKLADIGVAMGITGTDVAKEASDMIITDDNFQSIVSAVEEGRGIYDNIRKVVLFLLSCNMSEIGFMLVAIILGYPAPLLALQILWINLVTDSFPALALDMEPKEPDLMRRKPRNPKAPVITKDGVISILISSMIITTGTLFVFWYTYPRGIDHARTMALTTMVMFQMWTAIAYRSTTHSMSEIGWFSNPKLLGAIALSVFLMLPIIYIPQVQSVFGTTALGIVDWSEILIISVLGLVAVEIWEWINRKRFRYGIVS